MLCAASVACRKKPPIASSGPDAATSIPIATTATPSVRAPSLDAGSVTSRDAAPPESPTCAAVRAKNKTAWAKAPGCGAPAIYDTCLSRPDGTTWAIAVDSANDNHNEPTTPCSFAWRLLLFEPDSDGGASRGDSPRAEKSFTGSFRFGEDGLSRLIPTTDGVLLETHEEGPYGENPKTQRSVYVALHHTIAAHPDLVKRDVVDARDVDGDGLIDYVLASPFNVNRAEGQPTGMHYRQVTGPQPVAHLLADGKLSFDDTVAQSLVRRECPTRPRATPPKIRVKDAGSKDAIDAFEPVSTWLPCAKFWGVREEAIASALEACSSFVETSTLDADDFRAEKIADGACPQHLSEWASVKVPFVLR